MKFRRWLMCFCFLAGCGRDASPVTARITGHVTLDDMPLEKGLIQFVAQDGQSPTGSGIISSGIYALEVSPGVKRVEVTSPKVVGQQKMYDTADSPVTDLVEERIPPEYNARSNLKADVSREKTKFDFELKSQPAK